MAENGGRGIIVRDKDGNVIKRYSSLQEAADAGAIANPVGYGLGSGQGGTKAYRVGDNIYWKEPATTTMTFDKTTGKINIQGPSTVINDPDFQANFAELSNWTRAYQADPSFKFAVTDASGAETGETETLEERVARMNTANIDSGEKDAEGNAIMVSPVQSITNHYLWLDKIRAQMENLYTQIDEEGNITPVRLTEAEINRMRRDGTAEGTKETDYISIPKNWKGLEDVYSKAPSWDEENSVVTIKDFLEYGYNIDRMGEEKVFDLFTSLENYLASRTKAPVPTESLDNERYTGAMALYNYIRTHDPKMNFWTGASYVISAPVKGILYGGVDFAKELTNMTAGLATAATNAAGWLDAALKGRTYNPKYANQALAEFEAMTGAAAGAMKNLRKTGFNLDKAYRAAAEAISPYIQESLAELHTTTRALAGEGDYTTSRLADGIEGVAHGIYDLAKIIAIGNVFESAATGVLAGGAKAATTAATRIAQGGATASELGAGARTLVSLLGAENSVSLFNGLAKIANSKVTTAFFSLALETFGEALADKPSIITDSLVNGKFTSDGLQYISETFWGNTMGFFMAKGAMKLGETKMGRVISNNLTKTLYKYQTKVADAFDSLRVKWSKYGSVVEWIEGKFDPKTANTMEINRLIRAKRKEFSEMDKIKIFGKNADEIETALREAEESLSELRRFENLLDNYTRQSNLRVWEMVYSDDNPTFKAANEVVFKNYGELLEAEKGIFKSLAKTEWGTLLSKETSDYIGASLRNPILAEALGAAKKAGDTRKAKAIAEEMGHWTKVIADYEAKATPELLETARRFVDNYKTWWNEAMTTFSNMGLVSKTEIARWRAEGIWGDHGELYARLQRKQQFKDFYLKRSDGKITTSMEHDLGHYNYGSTDSFVDPILTMQHELKTQAEVSLRNDIKRAFEGANGATVANTAEEVAIRNRVKPQLKQYNKEASVVMKDVSGEIKTEGVFNDMAKRADLSEAERSATGEATRRVNRAVTKGEAQSALLGLDDEGIDTLWQEIYGDKTVEEVASGSRSSAPSEFSKPENPMLEEAASERYPDVLDGVSLTQDEKVLLYHRDMSSDTSTLAAFELRARGGDISDIGDQEWLRLGEKNAPSRGDTLKEAAPTVKSLSNKIHKNQTRRRMLYRIERVDGQNYKAGDIVEFPFTSFSSSAKITSFEGDFVSTRIFNPVDDHYIIKIRPGTVGSMDVSATARFSKQAEVLVSDQFEVVSIKEIPTPKGMRSYGDAGPTTGKTYEMVVKKVPDADSFVWPEVVGDSKRSILAQSDKLKNSTYMKNVVVANREESFDLMANRWLGESVAKQITEVDEQIGNSIGTVLSDFKDAFFAKGHAASSVAEDIAARYGGDYPDVVKDYLYYDALKHNKKQIAYKLKTDAEKFFRSYSTKVNGKTVEPYAGQATQLANRISERVSARIEIDYNAARNAIANLDGAKALVDVENWQKEIFAEAKKIDQSLEMDNRMLMRNESGDYEVVEVDPLLQHFLTSKPAGSEMSKPQKANYLWMKLFRAGTTGINPTSMVNQQFRDMGNAWILGNVNHLLSTAQDEIGEVFGGNIGRVLAQYSEEAQTNFQKLAAKQGKSLAQVIAESEMQRGVEVAKQGTETQAIRLMNETRQLWYEGGSYSVSGYDKMSRAIDNITDKLGRVNEARETYLRKLVYGNNFERAIKRGMSISQARTYAEYIANSATTNFSRQTTFMASIQNSIPYLRAAINGTKSFWRLFSMDPVGVTGRIIGGVVIPVIALTANSMNGEENLKAYKQIAEYQKENSLPVVVNGEAFMIPVPQELSSFINPIRHAIESVHGMHAGGQTELIFNDILAFSPLDLGGFTDVDSYNMFAPNGQTSWTDRLFDGSAKLFSQIAPKYLVSAATFISGKDLYTGQPIDTTYTVYNPDTGEQEVMGYSAGQLAKLIQKKFPTVSAGVAQEVLDSIFGTAPVDYIDWLISLGSGIVDEASGQTGAFGQALENTASEVAYTLTKPVHPYVQDQVDKAWRAAISELWDEKKALLVSDAWQNYLTNARNATTATAQAQVAAQRANVINPFYEKVQNTVNNLVNTYGGTLTSARFGSVVSLLNLAMSTADGNAAITSLNSETYSMAKKAAVNTMARLGFPSVSSNSVWGQIKASGDGGTYIDWATPLQILDMQYTRTAQSAIHTAELQSILERNNITSYAANRVWDAYGEEDDKEKKRQLLVDWDIKVATAIAPYVNAYGVDVVLNNNDAIDYLDNLILVPSDYKRYKGRSVYSPNLNGQRGFAKQFILDIFGGGK